VASWDRPSPRAQAAPSRAFLRKYCHALARGDAGADASALVTAVRQLADRGDAEGAVGPAPEPHDKNSGEGGGRYLEARQRHYLYSLQASLLLRPSLEGATPGE